MKKRLFILLLAVLGWAAPASAQIDEIAPLRIYLGSTGCVVSSSNGTPTGGANCDVAIDYANQLLYIKQGGTWKKATVATVPVADGGTGATSLTSNGVLYGNGTGAVLATSAGGSNSVLTANGGAPSFSSTPTVTTLTANTSVSTPTLTNGSNLALSPTGDIVLGPSGFDVLPNTGYTVNLGALTNKYLALHAAELWVETLVAQNTIATIGGRIIVAPTNTLTADVSTGATTITVKYNNVSASGSGDIVYLEANGAVEFMRIVSGPVGSGPYTYGVTRNLDGSGANGWTAGDALVNTGQTGNGFIDLYSVAGVLSGSGPTIVGNVRTGNTYNNLAARWAIGNLNGLFGYGATTYGSCFGDPSATNVCIDATNGFRIRSSTTDKLKADTSGNLALTGDLSVGTSGVARSGATAYLTGTGWWLEYNGGTPRFRIGNPAAQYLLWSGTNLEMVSATLNIDSTGPWINTIPGSYSSGSGYRFTTGYSGTNWVGLFSQEPNSSTRDLVLWNGTNQSSKTNRVYVEAYGAVTGATLTLTATDGGSSAKLTGSTVQLDSTNILFGPGSGLTLFDTNIDLRPVTDNSQRIGLNTHRFTLIRGVTITSGDLSFENGWTLTEAEKVGIDEEGLAILDENGELVAFIGKTGFQRRGGAGRDDVDGRAYVKTTATDRAKMDRHPEQRVDGYTSDGTPMYRTRAEKPLPDPKGGQTNTQRRGAAVKAGGQQ